MASNLKIQSDNTGHVTALWEDNKNPDYYILKFEAVVKNDSGGTSYPDYYVARTEQTIYDAYFPTGDYKVTVKSYINDKTDSGNNIADTFSVSKTETPVSYNNQLVQVQPDAILPLQSFGGTLANENIAQAMTYDSDFNNYINVSLQRDGSVDRAFSKYTLNVVQVHAPVLKNGPGTFSFRQDKDTPSPTVIDISDLINNGIPQGANDWNGATSWVCSKFLGALNMWKTNDAKKLFFRVLWLYAPAGDQWQNVALSSKCVARWTSTYYITLDNNGGISKDSVVKEIPDLISVNQDRNISSIVWNMPQHTVQKGDTLRIMYPIYFTQFPAVNQATLITTRVTHLDTYLPPDGFEVYDMNFSDPDNPQYSVAKVHFPAEIPTVYKETTSADNTTIKLNVLMSAGANVLTFTYNEQEDIMVCVAGQKGGNNDTVTFPFNVPGGSPSTYGQSTDTWPRKNDGSVWYTSWNQGKGWTKLPNGDGTGALSYTKTNYNYGNWGVYKYAPALNNKIYLGGVVEYTQDIQNYLPGNYQASDAIHKHSLTVYDLKTKQIVEEVGAVDSMRNLVLSNNPAIMRYGYYFASRVTNDYLVFPYLAGGWIDLGYETINSHKSFKFLTSTQTGINGSSANNSYFDVPISTSGYFIVAPIDQKSIPAYKVFNKGFIVDKSNTIWNHTYSSLNLYNNTQTNYQDKLSPFMGNQVRKSQVAIATRSQTFASRDFPLQLNTAFIDIQPGWHFVNTTNMYTNGSVAVDKNGLVSIWGGPYYQTYISSNKYTAVTSGRTSGVTSTNTNEYNVVFALNDKNEVYEIGVDGGHINDSGNYYEKKISGNLKIIAIDGNVMLTDTGDVYVIGSISLIGSTINYYPTPQKVNGFSSITQIAVKTSNSSNNVRSITIIGLRNDGKLFSAGQSALGTINGSASALQFGTDSYKKITRSFALATSGKVYTYFVASGSTPAGAFQGIPGSDWTDIWTIETAQRETMGIVLGTASLGDNMLAFIGSKGNGILYGYDFKGNFQSSTQQYVYSSPVTRVNNDPNIIPIFGIVDDPAHPAPDPTKDQQADPAKQDGEATTPIPADPDQSYDNSWVCINGTSGQTCVKVNDGNTGITIRDDDGKGNVIEKVIPIPAGAVNVTIRKQGDTIYIITGGKVVDTIKLTDGRLADFPLSGITIGWYDNDWNITVPPANSDEGFLVIGDKAFTFNVTEKAYPLGLDSVFVRSGYNVSQVVIITQDDKIYIAPILDEQILEDEEGNIQSIYYGGRVYGNNDIILLTQDEAQAFADNGYATYLRAIINKDN